MFYSLRLLLVYFAVLAMLSVRFLIISRGELSCECSAKHFRFYGHIERWFGVTTLYRLMMMIPVIFRSFYIYTRLWGHIASEGAVWRMDITLHLKV